MPAAGSLLIGVPGGFPQRPLGLRAGPGGQIGRLAGQLLRPLLVHGLVPELGGELAQPRGDALQLAQAAGPSPAAARTAAPRTPFTNEGASAPQYWRASPTASSSATSVGTSSRCADSCSATRMMLRSSGAIRSSSQPSAWLAIASSG